MRQRSLLVAFPVRRSDGAGHGFAFPRHEIARGKPLACPQSVEGAGNAGRPMRPIAACAMSVEERTRVSQVTPESPGTPCAMVYGLYVPSPATGFLATVARAYVSANLTPASGCQDHTTSPSVKLLSSARIKRAAHPHVHRIPFPTSVTIASRPSRGIRMQR